LQIIADASKNGPRGRLTLHDSQSTEQDMSPSTSKKSAALLPIVVVIAVVALTASASRWSPRETPVEGSAVTDDFNKTVAAVDSELERLWGELELPAAEPVDDLTILRRLSLALHGTLPSLEEIRLFEADNRPNRLDIWTQAMLDDIRFSQYFAERLARAYVGVEVGQLILYRRDRFTSWLSSELSANTRYDEVTRKMVTGEGVWTSNGEVNFFTSAVTDGTIDKNKLTARTVRAFLGQRIDCAQCHDHPFDEWKQSDFEGLAAHYGQIQLGLGGLIDNVEQKFTVQDSITLEDRIVEPSVPFHPEWLGTNGTHRQKIARWITHEENDRFERAIANRVWGLMFGRPFATDRAVDDLPDPGTDDALAMLDILGQDFRDHDCNLKRLIRVVAASKAFRIDSVHPYDTVLESGSVDGNEIAELSDDLQSARDRWAVFPLIRLRPEQVIGAMLQANNVRTVDQNSHLFVRIQKFFREQNFVDQFGDFGAEELSDQSGTIPQALLRMNGEFARDLTQTSPFSSPGRIMAASSTPNKLVENSYLVCLTRRPSEPELKYFLKQLNASDDKAAAVEDMFWALFNAPEFSWNH